MQLVGPRGWHCFWHFVECVIHGGRGTWLIVVPVPVKERIGYHHASDYEEWESDAETYGQSDSRALR